MKIILMCLIFSTIISAQIKYPFKSFREFRTKLDSVCSIADEVKRAYAVVEFFDTLAAHKSIPFAFRDTVALTYRGNATSVVWAGDFNGWSPTIGNFNGAKVGLSNVWLCVKSFPPTARLDYKIIVNNSWITDPENPNRQYSGVGTYNSELRMPGWVYPKETLYNDKTLIGNLSDNFSIDSKQLGYKIYYKVYTPNEYDKMSKLPTIYVTDGHEYSDERLGSMINVLNNLIHEKKIKPVIAVFIDPRSSSGGGTNRRGSEYTINKKFADFVADELVSKIDVDYKTEKNADSRAILGTSLGGLNSAYFGVYRSDVFRLIGIHSPAFQANKQIYDLYTNATKLPLKIFMSTGTIYDTQSNALQMKSILDSKGYEYNYIEVPEGHSWGNWRSLLDEPLIYFFKNDNSTGIRTEKEIPESFDLKQNYPNPFNPATKISYSITTPSNVSLKVYDALGNEVATLVNEYQKAGTFSSSLYTLRSSLSSGVYFYTLRVGNFMQTKKMILMK